MIEDNYLDNNSAWMDINVPEEQFLTMSEQQHFEIFKAKLAELRLETCNKCNEKDFNMEVHNQKCHQCHAV